MKILEERTAFGWSKVEIKISAWFRYLWCLLQGSRKLFYGSGRGGEGVWVKMSAAMVTRRRKLKKHWLISYLEFFFWQYYFGHTTFLYWSTCSSGHYQICSLIFKFCTRKSQSQQKLAKKITHFTIQFRSKYLTHFTNLSSLHIENDMLLQHSQKAFCNFPANMLLDTSIYSIKTLKFSRKFGLQW